jgi:hypothetical protein
MESFPEKKIFLLKRFRKHSKVGHSLESAPLFTSGKLKHRPSRGKFSLIRFHKHIHPPNKVGHSLESAPLFTSWNQGLTRSMKKFSLIRFHKTHSSPE